jgi:hypothetical protein
MSDSQRDTVPSASTATAEPPAPPAGPPGTGMATSGPGPKRGRGCLIAVIALVVLVVILVLAALVWMHSAASVPTPVTTGPAALSAFASVMHKAGVKAPAQPTAPVELAGVKPVGSHRFDATFTFAQLELLANVFSHTVTIRNTPVSLSKVTVTAGDTDGIALAGDVSAGPMTYSGRVSGVAAFENGRIVAPNPLSVSVAGLPIGGAQGKQVTALLLAYTNGYLAAAPGLKIDSATLTADGVHAIGTAPDSISW